jgi:hypothetical protein
LGHEGEGTLTGPGGTAYIIIKDFQVLDRVRPSGRVPGFHPTHPDVTLPLPQVS